MVPYHANMSVLMLCKNCKNDMMLLHDKRLDAYTFRIKYLYVSRSIWWVWRFVYPDVIKTYFIENVLRTLHNCTFPRGNDRLWKALVTLSRLPPDCSRNLPGGGVL